MAPFFMRAMWTGSYRTMETNCTKNPSSSKAKFRLFVTLLAKQAARELSTMTGTCTSIGTATSSSGGAS